MAFHNQADRERILHNRPEVLHFARCADYNFEHREEFKQAVAPLETAHEENKRRRWKENRDEQHELIRLRQISSKVGATLESQQELRRAEQAFEKAEQRRAKEVQEESSKRGSALSAAYRGEQAAEELRKLFMQDPELFDRGDPPRLKAEFKETPAAPPAAAATHPKVNEHEARWEEAGELQAALQREHLRRTLQPTA
jgi:hypothetical protein